MAFVVNVKLASIPSHWGTVSVDFSLFHGEKRGQLFFWCPAQA